MFLDPSLWVFMAFLSLILLVGNRGWQGLRQYLDQRAENIHNDIKMAQQLKEEAQFILNHALRLQKEMDKRSHEIMVHNDAEIQRLKSQAQQDLDNYLNHEENQLKVKLQQIEHQTIQHIEQKVINIAFAAAQQVVTSHTHESIHNKLFTKSLEEISHIPHRTIAS
ncbi:MAG: hypothetical protein ACRYGR_04615 [Janthinobacterium lividum]